MSILIKGMEMPKSCFMCPFSEINDADTDLCSITGELYDSTPFKPEFRRSDCPLIEIPPHGRLIDADAMERNMSDTVQGNIRGYPYSDTIWDMAFKWIDHQPTIIPADKED